MTILYTYYLQGHTWSSAPRTSTSPRVTCVDRLQRFTVLPFLITVCRDYRHHSTRAQREPNNDAGEISRNYDRASRIDSRHAFWLSIVSVAHGSSRNHCCFANNHAKWSITRRKSCKTQISLLLLLQWKMRIEQFSCKRKLFSILY